MGALEGYTILVVDDENEFRAVILSALKRHGCTMLEAQNGKAAFEILSTNKVDLVLSDIRMPEGSGIELLFKIGSLKDKPRIIMMTGFSDFDEAEIKKYGAQALIQKPFSSKDLLKIILEQLK